MIATASTIAAHPAGEQVLWCAVVARAVLDSLGQASSSVTPSTLELIRDQARHWLATPSGDRTTVLDHSGLGEPWLTRRLSRLERLWRAVDTGEITPRLGRLRRERRKAREPPGR